MIYPERIFRPVVRPYPIEGPVQIQPDQPVALAPSGPLSSNVEPNATPQGFESFAAHFFRPVIHGVSIEIQGDQSPAISQSGPVSSNVGPVPGQSATPTVLVPTSVVAQTLDAAAAVSPPAAAPQSPLSAAIAPSAAPAPTGVIRQIESWLGAGNNKWYAVGGVGAIVILLSMRRKK